MYGLIKKYEGFRAEAYLCPAEVWTIGYGTTRYPDGRPVKKGDRCDREQAEAWLDDWIMRNATPTINSMGAAGGFYPSRSQREALESLIYNWGAPKFANSKLKAAIIAWNKSRAASDLAEVARQWDVYGNPPLKGLVKRRIEELGLFMQGV